MYVLLVSLWGGRAPERPPGGTVTLSTASGLLRREERDESRCPQPGISQQFQDYSDLKPSMGLGVDKQSIAYVH